MTQESPLTLLPAPEPAPEAKVPRRIAALTEAGTPVTTVLSRLIEALRKEGSEVFLVAVPTSAPPVDEPPTIGELKRNLGQFARGVVRTLRGDFDPVAANWLESQLRAIEGPVDAWVTCDPALAQRVYPVARAVRPDAMRIGVDGDYHLEETWREVDCDALIVVHPGIATDLPSVREGRAHLLVGGTLARHDAEARHLDDRPMVVVSAARLDPGDIDPLLFQLSLAKPERFSLLFLPSGRTGVDELIRTRAANYGLQGKRPRAGADTAPWLLGASVIIGHPSPLEAALAVHAGIPQLIFSTARHLNSGDRFLIHHGAALHADIPITVSVHLESLLPGGATRDTVIKAASELETGGAAEAALAVLDGITRGRPEPRPVARTEGGEQAQAGEDELEDIGPSATNQARSATASNSAMPLTLRRAYLKEIILRQNTVERQHARALAGLETWQKRVRLARQAGQDALADQAVPRVEGLLKLTDRLAAEVAELRGLRDRFSSNRELSQADRDAASSFMSPDVALSLERGEAPDSAFAQLEIADALDSLKRRLGDQKP